MQPDDVEYFARRAKQEREVAATCEDNATALVHLRMADEYQRRLDALATATDTEPVTLHVRFS